MDFQRALFLHSDYPEAHNNLGVILAQEGKLGKAAKHFSAAVRIDPAYLDARRNLEKIKALTGRKPK